MIRMSKLHIERVAAASACALFALLLFSFDAHAQQQQQRRADALPLTEATQEADAPQAENAPRRNRRDDAKGELLSRLNLTPEQREQIRLIRQQTETDVRALMPRIRQARRALDRAIYLESADESVIEARVRELSAAQSEALRLRTLTELKIRRVLTPEQLDILRDLRRQGFDRQARRRRQGGRNNNARGNPLARRRDRLPASNANDADASRETSNPAPAFSPRLRRRDGTPRRPRP